MLGIILPMGGYGWSPGSGYVWSPGIGIGAGAQAAVHVGERALFGADNLRGLLAPALPPEIEAVAKESDAVSDVRLV